MTYVKITYVKIEIVKRIKYLSLNTEKKSLLAVQQSQSDLLYGNAFLKIIFES